ncbi:unnamed protein product [Cylindrotheca closterium]|uniref:Uncharacterized protein n=1 Tax=Cylindrotheca closterium TaxID=2856 RepID=A0AAD2G0M5_9STRA|nr:unnamed protein product [Cylindrotheca closterium]
MANKLDILEEIRKHRNNCVDLLQKLQKAHVNGDDVANAKNKSGWLPLHFVMVFCKGPGVLELVKFLWRMHPLCLQAKTDRDTLAVNLMPPTTNPQPVIDAMQRDQLEARVWLMKKYPQSIRMEDKDGETPLVRAIIGRCNILVAAMIQRFPELTQETNNRGRLPLHYAMESANAGAVSMLYGAYPDGIEEADNMGITPYYMFAKLPNKDPLIAALVDLMCEVFELDEATQPSKDDSTEVIYKQMLPQYAIDSNLSVWTEKVIWRLIKNWRETIQMPIPEIPDTPKENQHSTFATSGALNAAKDSSVGDVGKPRTTRDPTSFQKYTKKGQFEALRASFEAASVKG